MIVYGRNVAKELLESHSKIEKIIIQNGFSDKEIVDLIYKSSVKCSYVDKKILDKKVNGNHQGILLYIPDYKYSDISCINSSSFVVVLDHLEDPYNFGAIIRSCVAFGVDTIIIPKDRSVSVNSTVMKVSTGLLNKINICLVSNIGYSLDKLKDAGFWIIGASMNGTLINECDFSFEKKCLVIGNEGSGISSLVLKKCDIITKIPMENGVDSLNASVSAGILIYEIIRR